jgi:hypothetical protein
MHRAFLIYVAGLISGLSAATWSVHSGTAERAGASRFEAIGVQGADAAHIEEFIRWGALTANQDRTDSQDPAPAAEKPQETDRQRLERKVRKLLVDNGTQATQKQGIDSMLEEIGKMGLPPEFGEKFKARFDLDHVLDLAVKIYADHLDEATVDALITFFATPGGKKLAEATPAIMTELMQASSEYGEKIGREVGEELSK